MPQEVIRDYINKRRSEDCKDSEPPILTVKFSALKIASKGLTSDLDQVLCFEREPKLRTSGGQENRDISTTAEPKSLVSKRKRKLKDGKALHLDDLLQGMRADGNP